MNIVYKSYWLSNEKIIALLYALIPFTQMYKVPGTDKNLCYAILFGFGGCFALFSQKRGKYVLRKDNAFLGFTLWLFMLFYCLFHSLFISSSKVYRPGTYGFFVIVTQFLMLLICIIVFLNREVRRIYRRYIEVIAVVMAVVVVIQLVVYNVWGISVTEDRSFLLPFKSFFTNEVKETLAGSKMVINGLFRPSAFFLEPAHYSQYCTIALASSLAFEPRLHNIRAIVISLGIILTTSGIGIASVAILWGLKLFVNRENFSYRTIKRIVTGAFLLVIIFTFLMVLSGSFRMAVTRIVTGSGGSSSAIEGRLWSRVFLNQLKGNDLIFGTGFKNIPTYGENNTPYYMTGIIELLYCQGLVGTIIFTTCYVLMIVKSYHRKEIISVYIALLYIPFLIGSANLMVFSLMQYIPLLFTGNYLQINQNWGSPNDCNEHTADERSSVGNTKLF